MYYFRHNEDGSYTYGYEGADGSFKIETKLATGEVKGKYGYVDENGKVSINLSFDKIYKFSLLFFSHLTDWLHRFTLHEKVNVYSLKQIPILL